MNVIQLSELMSEIDHGAPRSSLGFGIPNSLLLKWQSYGPNLHKHIRLESEADADLLLVWWLSHSQVVPTEVDGLTVEYLLSLGPFYVGAEIDDADRLPYDWLVRLFDCEREFNAERYRVSLPSSYTMNRQSESEFQIWIAGIERILEVHPTLGPKLFKRIAAYATAEMPRGPKHGVMAPLRLLSLVYDARPDLQAAFDLASVDGFHAYVRWFLHAGLLQYRLVFHIFLHWLQPEAVISNGAFCGEAALPQLIRQAVIGLGPQLVSVEASNGPATEAGMFGWWLRSSRNLETSDEALRTRIEIVRIVRAFWFHANFGVLSKVTKSDLPRHLTRLHASKPELSATYDLAEPEGRAAFVAWWDNTGRDGNPDFNLLDREFHFSPTLGVEQDLRIPITNAALNDRMSCDHSFSHLDLSTSLGRLNFFESFAHLWSIDQLSEMRQKIVEQLGSSDKFVEDLCGVARQIISAEPLPISSNEHQDWWRTEQESLLYRVGYNSYQLRAFAEIPSKSTTVTGAATVDVEIAGFPRSENGQGEDARTVFQSLKQISNLKLSLYHTRRSLPLPNKAAAELEQFIAPNLQKTKVRIFAFSAFDMLAEEQYEGLAGFSAKHLIGYWPWELSRWPHRVPLPLRIVDEIWSSTRFIVDSLTPVTTKPVIHMPLPVTIDMATLPIADGASDLPSDRFNFVFVFDAFSYFERKNPLAVIHAFQRAFPKSEGRDVGLTIKTMNATQLPIMLALKMFADTDSRINLIYETWDRPRVMRLVASADVMVSLHRSEGFGRLMAEAMLLGTPVIASDYSGNRDFCTAETAFMVGGTMKPLLEGDYIFGIGQEWLEPSIDEAAHHMRSIFQDPGSATKIVETARANIQQNYSLEACGRRYADRIKEILASQ